MGGVNQEIFPCEENWAQKRLCRDDYSEYVTGLTLMAFSEVIRDIALKSNIDSECVLQKYFMRAMTYWTFLTEEERQKKIEPFLLDLETELFR